MGNLHCPSEGERFLDWIDASFPDDDGAKPSTSSSPVAAIPSSRTMKTTVASTDGLMVVQREKNHGGGS
jgi:hypothetical protein